MAESDGETPVSVQCPVRLAAFIQLDTVCPRRELLSRRRSSRVIPAATGAFHPLGHVACDVSFDSD
jgi:hypothetical protein